MVLEHTMVIKQIFMQLLVHTFNIYCIIMLKASQFLKCNRTMKTKLYVEDIEPNIQNYYGISSRCSNPSQSDQSMTIILRNLQLYRC